MLAHPANSERLAEEGHSDVSSFIPAYLIQGMPGYVAQAGLAQRVSTVDGRLEVASPPGGPTRVTVELPLRA